MADVKLFFPAIMLEVQEFQRIAASENPELETLWNCLEEVFADQFVEEATIRAIKKCEKALQLLPKGTDTIEQRRQQILLRMNEQLPYTFRRLKQLLNAVCGEYQHSVQLAADTYQLTVKTQIMPQAAMDALWSMLERVVPMNLILRLLQEYIAEEKKLFMGAYTRMVNTVKVYPHMVRSYSTATASSMAAMLKYSSNVKVEADSQ